MTVTATMYGKAALHLGNGDVHLAADTLKVALTNASYVPNPDTDEFFSAVTNEISASAYVAGGATLTTVTWTYDSTNHRAVLTADPVTWTAPAFTVRRAVVYESSGFPSTSILLFWVDFGADQSPAGSNFTIDWTNGLLSSP